MANSLPLFLSLLLLLTDFSNGVQNPANITKGIIAYPMQCSKPSSSPPCSSVLYVPSKGLSPPAVASVYSANATLIRTIFRQSTPVPDYLVEVSCQCEDSGSDTVAYFHDTRYSVQQADTPSELTAYVFSGLAWNITDRLQAGQEITVRLLCGCYKGNDRVEVVSYAVQQGDTLTTIASMLSADWGEIVRMNERLLRNPEYLVPGWVLFVPMGTAAAPPKGNE